MRPLRLKARLTLALLSLALVPLGLMTIVLVRLNLDRLRVAAQEYRMAVAEGAVRSVLDVVDRARTEIETTGAALADRDVPVDDRFRAARARLLGSQYLNRVALYDREGRHVETLASSSDVMTPERPEVLDVDARRRARDATIAFEEVPAGSPADRPFLPVVVPLYQGAERALWGYLWTALDLAPISREIADASSRRFPAGEGVVYLLDTALRILAHPDPEVLRTSVRDRGFATAMEGDGGLLPRARADFATEYDVGGRPVLGVVVPVPGLDWIVVVEQDRAEAYRVLRMTWQTALAVGALFAGIALLLGLLLGRRLAQPVLAIAAAARRVAGGDFEARVAVDRRDEVGELSGSFNRMASDLVDYRDRLVDETRIRTNLSRYLSPDVVETIVAQRTDLALGGTRREVTVLFADVVAFTPLAERVEPERVVAILNELFTFLTEIVFRHGGTVDKFVGDCVMAVFGAPYGGADDPVRAVRAADEMMRWLDVGNARWSKEIGCELQLAIGLNTGQAVAGNIGSTRRMEYTVIGDAVNLAARLESLARPGQVLMSRATRDRVEGEFECVHVATARLPGRSEETEMWALAE